MFRLLVLALTSFLFFTACNKDSDWIDRYKRSERADIDLFLIPQKYALLESSWIKKTSPASFDKAQLASALARYGRSLEDLKRNPKVEYKEEGNIVHLKVGPISHSTAYDYDTAIPLLFSGKWFEPGQYSDTVYQQHIAPTLAKAIGVTAPSGVEVQALPVKVATGEKPEIVVVAVIDQGGMNLLETHKAAAPRIFALMQKSANYTNAHVGHLDSHTAVGHMAIGTGAFPGKSSVIGNTFFSMERKNGKSHLLKSEIYAGKDETKVNPAELKAESLADVLNITNKGKSVVISQSYALRASIGMGGHGAQLAPAEFASQVRANNFIYWLDPSQSRWITDTRYYSLPAVAKAADVLLNFIKYYPQGYNSYVIRDRKEARSNWGVMMATPAETQLEGEQMRAIVQEEILNKKKALDGMTDLVYISFKSADAVGHQFGYYSLEARETLKTIDEQIGKLEDFLVKNYGDKFVLVLTADHGCAPLTEISGGQRLTIEEVIDDIDTLLPSDVRQNHSLIKFMTVGQISLNHDLMKAHSITEEQVRNRLLAIQADGQPFFRRVLNRQDLRLAKK